ncbi:metal-sulfur cluster assembly factor [Alphaproteobacteria bacterium]|jgi:FeS assembly SUF system protein|nr:iron-sulfur cluster assembly protein [Alphaproteobacteria bacterium]MDC3270682.1 metal-sulfur cluster assembly factor [Alphaproteobacteria bacterium]
MTKEKKLEDFLPNKNGSYYKEFEHQNEVSLISKEEIIECIKTVMDPEIPVNLYDLGLIYSINNNNNNLLIEMTLTNPNCPVAGQMPENVAKSIEQIYDLRSIEVKLVWKPTWSKDLMSEDAKLALDIF